MTGVLDVGIRVMMSMGGVTYKDFWDEPLSLDATQVGLHTAETAPEYGVSIEIDYGRNTDPNLDGLQRFVERRRPPTSIR